MSDGSGSSDLHGIALRQESEAERLAERVANDVAATLARAIEQRGMATLVVSGGSTPPPMFARLRRLPLDWARVTVTLADERVIAPDDEQSNERLVRDTLLQDAAAAASFVSLYEAGLDGAQAPAALSRVQARLAAVPRPFDLVLLGMGGDGHTASLFPDADELEAAMRPDDERTLALLHPPSQPLTRISLVAPVLIDARHLWLHITGESKRSLLDASLAEGALPIARVLQAAATSDATRPAPHRAIYWSP